MSIHTETIAPEAQTDAQTHAQLRETVKAEISILREAGALEARLVAQLRDAVKAEIARRCLTDDELAALLGLLPAGVGILSARTWTFQRTVRVAAALGLEVAMTVQNDERCVPQITTPGALARPSGLAAQPEPGV
jgi:hypothetical protein